MDYPRATPHAQCYAGSHWMWMALGAFMLILYGLGIPAFAFYKLHKYHLSLDDHRTTYGFLFASYSPEASHTVLHIQCSTLTLTLLTRSKSLC